MLIAGNWKMYKGPSEAAEFCRGLRERDLGGVDTVVCPPYLSLAAAVQVLAGTEIAVAAQNVHWEAEGAFTGEVSGPMIREAGAEYVIIGHSERRTLFGESDATVNQKVNAALAAGLTPIACIGETLDQRERNETFDVLDRQIKQGFDGLTAEQIGQLVVAYEPVWAIGTGRNATPEQAAEAHGHIRKRLRQWFGGEAADLCHILYGGSVKPDNIAALAGQPDVDGALVGGASLDVKAFFDILKTAAEAV